MTVSLVDLIFVRTPCIAIIEPDLTMADAVVRQALGQLGEDVSLTLEWELGHCWKGPKGVMTAAGLETQNLHHLQQTADPAPSLEQLTSWMRSLSSATTEMATNFRQGVVLLYDLEAILHLPTATRVLLHWPAMLQAQGATVLAFVRAPLPASSPLSDLFVPWQVPADPMARYGAAVHQHLAAWRDARTPGLPTDEAVAADLAGLTVAQADVVLRLVVLEATMLEDVQAFPWQRTLAECRARLGFAPLPPG